MILAVILLSATGYLSYRSLSSIVSSIRVDTKPDLRLLYIREISMDLEKAENSVRIFSITKDTADLQPYYTIISGIDGKVDQLRSECIHDSLLLKQVDIICNLIEENIIIWNKLLYLSHNDHVNEYLKQLSYQLDSASLDERKKEKGILKRVFSSSKKSMLNEQELIDNINKIEQQDSITNERLRKRESQLASTGGEIKEQFYDLTAKMEGEVAGLIKEKASAANMLAGKTYRWLALFSILGTFLVILVLFIIVQYVRKTNAYQVALEYSKEEAEKLARTKEMFMANMSHEIRTPVTAISGFTEQLLHESFDENTTHTLNIIKSSSDHLARIIDDILDFSKLQNGKLALEKVHFIIRQILDDVYAMFEKQAQRNSTRLSYSLTPDTPRILFGDPYRLKQIMINLVGNAIKFTKNGEVHFSIDCRKKQSDEVELTMEFIDTGIGIDEDKLEFIFEDFTQAEMSTTRKYGGTGLGLSIVKKLIELHNGNIECKSRKNQGTKITCRIPYLTGDEKQVKRDVEPPLSIPEEMKKLRILVVDDEEYNRLLFKTILDRWKLEYREAVNGIEALEMVKTESFDLLFMDVRMPGIDGLKATKFIRDELNIKASEMPVVGISAACTNEDRQKYEKAGMNAFLSKPFTEAMLLTTILSVIRKDASAAIDDIISEEEIKSSATEKINLHNLYHISGGDEQFVKQMLNTFIETTEKGLKEINEAVASGKWESVAGLAHKISPPCRHIGAVELYNYLRKIEEIIRNNADTGSVKTIAGESAKEFEAIRGLLNERIASIK
jgi:signal transduction histidine kinase/CheY-like chemotaxis protein/HPt (histidine-containing phosphotransfer) domain-containing protein